MAKYSIDNNTSTQIDIPVGDPPVPHNRVGLAPNSVNNIVFVNDKDAAAFETLVAATSGLVMRILENSVTADQGAIGEASCKMSVVGTAADTFTIGATVYKLVASIGAIIAQAQVKIGASATATRANAIDAINGNLATKGTTWQEASTPAVEKVKASEELTLTAVMVQNADKRGGDPVPGTQTLTLANSLTQAGDGFGQANLNLSGNGSGQFARLFIGPVSAAMITKGFATVGCPFTPTKLNLLVLSSTGSAPRNATSDTATIIDTSRIKVTLAGGATPAIQANDVICVEAYG